MSKFTLSGAMVEITTGPIEEEKRKLFRLCHDSPSLLARLGLDTSSPQPGWWREPSEIADVSELERTASEILRITMESAPWQGWQANFLPTMVGEFSTMKKYMKALIELYLEEQQARRTVLQRLEGVSESVASTTARIELLIAESRKQDDEMSVLADKLEALLAENPEDAMDNQITQELEQFLARNREKGG